MTERRLFIVPNSESCEEASGWLRSMKIDFEKIDLTKRFVDIGTYGIPLLVTSEGSFSGTVEIRKYAYECYKNTHKTKL